ncbi:MAG: hypothetical protein JSS02_28565 [Planctomycetes bacterium]|nr:hypothetical protein [Planctomycetota bacterium]
MLLKRFAAMITAASMTCIVLLMQPQTNSTVARAQLADDLKMSTSGSIGDRRQALERLSHYWSPRQFARTGFSDLPVEPPHSSARSVPAGDVDAIATVLQAAIADTHDGVREAAAICLSNAPEPRKSVAAAIAIALKSEDSTVLWYLWQLDREKFRFPEPAPYVANLIRHLKSGDFTSSYSAMRLIEHFGMRFSTHTEAIVESLADISEDDRWQVLLTLAHVGLSEAAANQLPARVEADTPRTKAAAFVALLPFPNKATRFLRDHPDLGEEIAHLDHHWFELLCSNAPKEYQLREALAATPHIGPLNLAMLGSAASIPELTRELETADIHRRTILRACIRACGGEMGDVVHLSEEVPVSFKPKSAWPGSDPRRKSEALGHGDGFTDILVTGELRFRDGGHPAEIHFLRTNDAMLMGESSREPMPVKYDAETGRFVLRTHVFAAYDMGEAPEPGPYQTGSAQVRIEAPNCRPLVIQFFDEMPHVVIELRRK